MPENKTRHACAMLGSWSVLLRLVFMIARGVAHATINSYSTYPEYVAVENGRVSLMWGAGRIEKQGGLSKHKNVCSLQRALHVFSPTHTQNQAMLCCRTETITLRFPTYVLAQPTQNHCAAPHYMCLHLCVVITTNNVLTAPVAALRVTA